MRRTGALQRSAVCLSFSPGMASSRQDYIAPWWTYWLHNFPHLNVNFQAVDNTFKPEDASYQQVRGVGCIFSLWRRDRGKYTSNYNAFLIFFFLLCAVAVG